MSSQIKIKTKKKVAQDTRVTLDAKHKENLLKITQKCDNLPVLEERRETLMRRLTVLIESGDRHRTRERHEIETEISQIDQEITDLRSRKPEIDYFLNVGSLLYEYYDTKERWSQQDATASKPTKPVSSYSILSYFAEAPDDTTSTTTTPHTNKPNLKSREHIMDLYLHYTDERHMITILEEDDDVENYCATCGGEKMQDPGDAVTFCKNCGKIEKILVDSDKPSYKDPPKEIQYYAYKPINHFNELLSQFQGKESTEIPHEVYEDIKSELRKEKIYITADEISKLDNIEDASAALEAAKRYLTPKKLRAILKKCNMTRYYEHNAHIIYRLTGIPPPCMSRENEERLRSMFKEILPPWMKYCPPWRSNLPSYAYVIYKLCELLSLDEFLPYFNLLKSREKLCQHDEIWKKICNELGWEFIKSI
jgi:hypothetical protein